MWLVCGYYTIPRFKTKSQRELRVYWEMVVLCYAYPIIKVFIFVDLHFGKNQIEKPLLSKIKDEAHEGLNTPFSCLELRRWDLDVLCREC